MLIKRAAEEPGFFYSVKLDSKSRIQNLFWRGAMMKDDYLLYHDVKIFDTTYRTNRYNIICGAFVGINNHWSNVMFGCAFISDETTESFEWLFKTFNESMGGDVFPTSIFTDQDQAMSNAIEKVWERLRNQNSIGNLTNDGMNWRNEILPKCHNLILQCHGKVEAKALFNQSYLCLTEDVNTLFGRMSLSETSNGGGCTSTTTILDPARCTTKGRSAMIKRPSKAKKQRIKHHPTLSLLGM